MDESLRRLLREEIASYDAMLSTTPHLSRIHHAEVALLELLDEPNRRPPPNSFPLTDAALEGNP